MANIIHIETSTDTCSVALSQDGLCIFNREDRNGPSHAKVLAPMVEDAIETADSRGLSLDAVAVSAGPGSCYGRNLKLVGISTLELMCVPVLLGETKGYNTITNDAGDINDDLLFCPMIDARRMEVYTALYDCRLKPLKEVEAKIIDESSYQDVLAERPIVFFGNGATKCKNVIKHDNAHFIDGIEPLARYMLPLADKSLMENRTEDVAYFEPFYLKEFIAGTPKKLF